MAKKPVTLYAQADNGSSGIDWSLDDKCPVNKGKKKKINFPKNFEYDVTVNLIDNTGTGLVFKTSDPIWVQSGGSCPPQSGVNSTEIDTIVPGTSTLTFTNHNWDVGEFIYQLNFVDAAGVDAKPQLDPEFKNNGGGGRTGTSAARVAVIAVVTVLVVVLALTSMDKLGQ